MSIMQSHNIKSVRRRAKGHFEKLFKPVTSKLDDVIVSNLKSKMPQVRRPQKKGEVPNYGIDIDDEVEDMGLDDLFGDYVPPQQEKQLVPKPPTYEESLADVLEGKKEIYVGPQYIPSDTQHLPQDQPPEYYDEGIDYTIADEDLVRETLDFFG